MASIPQGRPETSTPCSTSERRTNFGAAIINARIWAGLHYRFSGVAGVVLGRNVAKYDLKHAFQPIHD